MTNMEKAKAMLADSSITLALVKANTVYSSTLRGVAPMVKFLSEKTPLDGFSAADKVVGKAAAMLFVLAGVKEVYAHIITQDAVDIFASHGVSVSYGEITDKILNRAKTDICPMEKSVRDIDNPEAAFSAIKNALEQLMSNKTD